MICPMGRKDAKRNATEKAHDLVLDVLIKELSTLGTASLKNNIIWERYVLAQEKMAEATKGKADATKKVVKLTSNRSSV